MMAMQPEEAARELDLKDYVTRMSAEISLLVSHQRDAVLTAIETRGQEGERLAYCALVRCAPVEQYRIALQEAIAVLEQTRKQFKSQQLEQLRKKLQQVLMDGVPKPLHH
ncbi:MAG: hypothetical protein ACP5M4_12725 [Acidobacteriaceae bacterium]